MWGRKYYQTRHLRHIKIFPKILLRTNIKKSQKFIKQLYICQTAYMFVILAIGVLRYLLYTRPSSGPQKKSQKNITNAFKKIPESLLSNTGILCLEGI